MFFLKNNPSIFKEKKKKELSMLKLPDGLIKSFLKESSLFFSKKDTEKINDLLKFILKTSCKFLFKISKKTMLRLCIRLITS